MNRRHFLAGLGVAAALPRSARAEQGVPVIGYLSVAAPNIRPQVYQAFRDGLKDTGYVDPENLRIEYRWAEGHPDRLPALAADLVARRVALIAAPGSDVAPLAAKAATLSIPIVFAVGPDPVELGLVSSLNRPGGNATGVAYRFVAMIRKRFELLHELVPKAATVAVIVDASTAGGEREATEAEAATRTLGLNLIVRRANSVSEFSAVFPALVERKAAALVIGDGPLLNNPSEDIAALAVRYRLPTIADNRDYAAAGGLASYGANLEAGFREAGAYAGRILKGAKPAELPVQQSDRFELVINLKTAKALGLAIPPTLLVRADDVIE